MPGRVCSEQGNINVQRVRRAKQYNKSCELPRENSTTLNLQLSQWAHRWAAMSSVQHNLLIFSALTHWVKPTGELMRSIRCARAGEPYRQKSLKLQEYSNSKNGLYFQCVRFLKNIFKKTIYINFANIVGRLCQCLLLQFVESWHYDTLLSIQIDKSWTSEKQDLLRIDWGSADIVFNV